MLDPQTTAFVFPGQGSQFVGMGQALAQTSAAARATFAEADEALGFALSSLCWEGPEETLNDTLNTQPALLAVSIAALRALHERLGDFTPRLVAGHSLGEISALVAAGAMEFDEGLSLVRTRGMLMKAAGERAPGGMAAILALDAPALVEICAEASASAGGVVQVANDNCPGQVVISGELAALEKAMELAKAKGARRALRLPVSIAAHSPLMQSAVPEFRRAVEAVPFISPLPEIVANVTAAPMSDPNDLRGELPAQLTSPVRWTETIRYMIGAGITTFVEVGAKDVLTGLLKRIDPNVTGLTLGTPDGLEALLAR
jgi:[acyl-carrier-protein] S-malonyltransferase